MSDENKGGSDLDIFEGLGKKSTPRTAAAVPPPPPGSGSHTAAKPDMKRTLLGIPEPARGSSPSVPAAPPAPPAPASSPPFQAAVTASSPAMPAAPVSSPPPLPASAGGPVSVPAPVTAPAGSASSPPPLPPPASQARTTSSGSLPPVTPSRPPPPPGRASLPAISSPPPSLTPNGTARAVPPPPASTRPAPSAAPTMPSVGPSSSASTPVAVAKNGKKLDMDWDDDQEQTHVFDKESRDKEKAAPDASSASLSGPEPQNAERADLDAIMSSPPPRTSQVPPIPSVPPAAGTPAVAAPTPSGSVPPAPASLSGAFASLGANGAASSSFKSAPPASQSMRSAPPPPPGSIRPHNPSTSTAPMPPPPPPGQTVTAPMHMPPRASAPPPPAPSPSGPPSAGPSQPPASAMPQMPPVQRAMEATAMVPRAQPPSRTPMWIGLLIAIVAIAGVGVWSMLQQRGPGTLVVNVADARGQAVSGLEVYVDDAKRCDSAPCILRDLTPGAHLVKVVAPGFEPPAPRGITIEAQKSMTVDVPLVASKAAAGTGVKVSGTQPGVKLYVDGKEIGALPQEVKDLEPGDHKIKIAGSDRYAPVEKTVSVGKSEMVDLGNIALKVLKGKATIQLGTPGAKVYLVSSPTNRKEVPQFPIAIDFDPNEKWELVATKDGFDELRQPISFDDGIAEKTFTVTLNPKGTTPPVSHAAVHTTPAQPATQPVAASQPPAAKQPAAFLQGEKEAPAAAPAAPAAPKTAPAAAAGEAFLNINSLPASTVVLDGKPLGPTPKLKVSVTPGAHTILFVNAEQSLKKSITVNVAAGETKPAFAKLRD